MKITIDLDLMKRVRDRQGYSSTCFQLTLHGDGSGCLEHFKSEEWVRVPESSFGTDCASKTPNEMLRRLLKPSIIEGVKEVMSRAGVLRWHDGGKIYAWSQDAERVLQRVIDENVLDEND